MSEPQRIVTHDVPNARGHGKPSSGPLPPLARAVASGMVWTYASFACSKLLVFATTVVLARLLLPEEFGVVGYALIVIGYLEVARDLGVGAALITRKSVDRRVASTAFFLSLGWGVLLMLVVALGAPALGSFFRDDRAIPVARVLSLGFLLSALASTHEALLYRSLSFNRRVVPDIAQAVVKGVVSVTLAWLGFGAWSLVLGQLAGQAIFGLAAWIMQPFRPHFEWDPPTARWLLSFGSTIVAADLMAGVLPQLGYLVVGEQLGPTALGIYTVAQRIPELILLNSFVILSTVLFPVLARLQDDPASLQKGYLAAQRYMTLFAFPVAVGLATVAPLFVGVFYGSRWDGVVPVMQLAALRYGLASLGWHAGDIARATGRGRLQMVLILIPVIIVAPMLVPAARMYGVEGVTAALLASTGIAALTKTVVLRRVVKLPIRAALAAVVPGTLAAGTVFLAAAGFIALTAGLPDLVRLFGATAVGGVVYLATVAIVSPDLVALVRARLQGRVSGAAGPVLDPDLPPAPGLAASGPGALPEHRLAATE